ncbi:DUF6479 family protein [Streptomyces sp. NPDC006879]|uniref:DUF6479 family protein n=1 Tax=Streptomyces sp. NPDC006879 TaxID=3364767 RepID=UPI0036C0C989
MDTETLANIAPMFLVGIAISGFLLAAFWWGVRLYAKRLPTPTPESQPHREPGGPVWDTSYGDREPAEIPQGGLWPHEMMGYGNFGSRPTHP